MNPGQSVKDRAALYIIRDAVAARQLRPGGTIVEGTAGNTGIGLAMVGNALGFRTVIVIPETQSQEKKDALRLLGAELVEVPARPLQEPEQLREVFRPPGRRAGQDRAERRHLGQPVRQRRQPPGPHRSTGPEIWARHRRQGRRLRLARSAPAARSPASPTASARQAPRHPDRASPTRRARRSSATTPTASSRPRAPRSPRASARAASPRTSRALIVDRAYQIPDAEAVPIVFDLLQRGGAVHGRLDRRQRRRRHPAGAARWAPATPSSPCSATTARAISRSSSTRHS